MLILVDNPDGRLSVGQTMGVTITVAEQSGVLEVPSAAILDQGEGPVLTAVRDGKTVALHPELGTSQAGWVAVSKTDLKEGEPVIVEGGYNLPEGTAVKTEEPKSKNEEEESKSAAKSATTDEHENKAEGKAATTQEHENKAEGAVRKPETTKAGSEGEK